MKHFIECVALAFCVLAATMIIESQAATAAPTIGENIDPGAHMGPPQEAIDACVDKASGDACSVTTPNGDVIEGTCDQRSEADTLACKPEGAPPGINGPSEPMGPKEPPQEAIDACAYKKSGDACTVTKPSGDVGEGTCDQIPDSETIACRPNDMPQM